MADTSWHIVVDVLLMIATTVRPVEPGCFGKRTTNHGVSWEQTILMLLFANGSFRKLSRLLIVSSFSTILQRHVRNQRRVERHTETSGWTSVWFTMLISKHFLFSKWNFQLLTAPFSLFGNCYLFTGFHRFWSVLVVLRRLWNIL